MRDGSALGTRPAANWKDHSRSRGWSIGRGRGWRREAAGVERTRAYWGRGRALEPETIRTLLTETRTWAVVGCSPDPRRDSHRIARLLQERGFRVIPVNPHVDEVLGARAYPTLRASRRPSGVDVVDIFRRADRAGAHVDEAIATGAGAVWMQLGVIDEAAAQRALDGRSAGRDEPLPGDRASAPRRGVNWRARARLARGQRAGARSRATIHPYVDATPGPFYYQRAAHPVGPRPSGPRRARRRAARCCSPRARPRPRRWCSRCSSPGATVAVADGGYWGTVALLRGELARWGLEVVTFDQTGRAAAAPTWCGSSRARTRC